MDKKDYKTNFEEEKQEVKLDGDGEENNYQTRSELHKKKSKPRQNPRHKLVNGLFLLFVSIPIIILILVIINWNAPSKQELVEKEEAGVVIDKGEEKKNKLTAEEKAEQEKAEQEKIAAEEARQEAARIAQEEEAKRAEEAAKQAEEAARKEREAEAARQAEAARKQETARQAEAARKQEAEAAAKKEADRKAAEQQQSTQKPQGGGKTHTVASGETLYRISVNYYGSGDGVEKIKQANGLSSNNISKGQRLVIP